MIMMAIILAIKVARCVNNRLPYLSAQHIVVYLCLVYLQVLS